MALYLITIFVSFVASSYLSLAYGFFHGIVSYFVFTGGIFLVQLLLSMALGRIVQTDAKKISYYKIANEDKDSYYLTAEDGTLLPVDKKDISLFMNFETIHPDFDVLGVFEFGMNKWAEFFLYPFYENRIELAVFLRGCE